jgi:TatD DNase family protein
MKDKYRLYEGIIDSHFHQLEMIKKDLDPEIILKNCISKGLTHALDISTNTDFFDERLSFADKFPEVHISAGLSVGKAEETMAEIDFKLSQLEKQLEDNKENPKLKALGETGLDRYWNHGDRMREMHLFESQVMLAEKYSLPVIIHNREADNEILEVLTRLKPSKGGIIHCFSTDWPFAEKALDLGFMISFAGNLTYKKTEEMREACRKTPLSSILIETDAPFLTPQKVRKYKNHPGFIGYTYELAAEIKDIETEELVSRVRNNFKRLLSIS